MLKIKKIILKYKVQIILIIIFIASAISIYIQDKDRRDSFAINSTNIEKKDDKIGVYISGEIKNEGVYYLDKDSRVVNLIDIAGGLTENADISKINPAQKLNDSDKVIISRKTNEVEDTTQYEEDEINEEKNSSEVGEKININTATKVELQTLSGIGEAIANKIIDYRKNNPFIEIEDIMNVPGIGESKFNNIKDDICV